MVTYAPLSTLKAVADRIWIIDGPAVTCRRVPLSTRATVVQLAGGGLWVHSPTGLTEALQAELAALGPVQHLVAPSWSHDCFFADWQAAYPQAKSWGVADGPQRFDQPLGGEAIWSREIDHLVIEGSRKHREAAFFHRVSRTLIVADLIQSIETARLPAWARPLVWFSGCDDSDGKMPYGMRTAWQEEPLMRAVEQMIAWGPHALILSHGRWYRHSAVDELKRAFRRQFHRRRWRSAMAAKTG